MSRSTLEDGEASGQHRRRGAALEQALLAATWEELKEVGYYNLTFDNVAARAGTSKAVLYRRWANRLELVRAAMRAQRPLFSGGTPNTGSLRGDVIALLDHATLGMGDLQPDVVWGMLMDVINDAAHQSAILDGLKRVSDTTQRSLLLRQIHETNIAAMTAILQQAEARGEVTLAKISPRVMTLPFDLMRHELLLTGRPTIKDAIMEIVDEIFLPLVLRTGRYPQDASK
jgi:AcrR family transcriptional regulator